MRHTPVTTKRRPLGIELLLLLAICVAVLPILWGIWVSLLPNRAIVSPDWRFEPSLINFEALFEPGQVVTSQLLNSILITLGTTALVLVLAAPGAYGLSKLSPPKWVLAPAIAIAVLMPLIPPMTLVPGMYVQMASLRLIDTVYGLIILNTVVNLPFAVLLLRAYFDEISDEIREASLIDGASELRSFLSIVLPIVRPGIAAVAVFVAIMAWNEFLFGLTMSSGGRRSPLTVGISSLVQPYEVTWGQMAAAGVVAAIPIIVLAAIANRQLVAGLTQGAVKG